MSITKDSTGETYRIRNNGEWATIQVFCWDGPKRSETRLYDTFCGEILIHSSYGSWANSWSSCAVQFKEFLTECDFSYIFGKLMESKLDVFDAPKSSKFIIEQLFDSRRQGSLTKEEAREIYDDLLIDHCQDEAEFVYTLEQINSDLDRSVRWFLDEPWQYICHSPSSQATGFWKDIWPVFVEQLKQEITKS